MSDRTELLEAALHSLPEGVALLGAGGAVAFWNQAAEAIMGYTPAELLAQPIPAALEPLLEGARHAGTQPAISPATRGTLVHPRHKLGHTMPAIARVLALRDGLGERIGLAVLFHPAESLDALPRGESGEDADVLASQADLEERLEQEYEDFAHGEQPLGILWISVDQAHGLRKTHGAGACQAMMEKVQRALAQGLRPAEHLGRWGEDEFLVIAHERTSQMLIAHAQHMAGLARTADFRWWGDRVSLTVSIGAAQAGQEPDEILSQLLERARSAMEASTSAGGNRVTSAPGRQTCWPS